MFKQVQLTVPFEAFEPQIDAATMQVHYTGHHATYTKNLNTLVEEIQSLRGKTIEEILTNLDELPEAKRDAVRNNGGGYHAHNIYFEALTPGGKTLAEGDFQAQIMRDFGSFETLEKDLSEAALAQFGSGYAWLCYCAMHDKLSVCKTQNQELPMMDGKTKVLLAIDVWEHAYYLKHKNKRADHIKDLLQCIDWTVVEARFQKVKIEEYAYS